MPWVLQYFHACPFLSVPHKKMPDPGQVLFPDLECLCDLWDRNTALLPLIAHALEKNQSLSSLFSQTHALVKIMYWRMIVFKFLLKCWIVSDLLRGRKFKGAGGIISYQDSSVQYGIRAFLLPPELVPLRHAVSVGKSARQRAKKSERSHYTLYFRKLIQINFRVVFVWCQREKT